MDNNSVWRDKAIKTMTDYAEKISLIKPLLSSSIDKIDSITAALLSNEYKDVNELEDIRIVVFRGVRNQMATLLMKYSFAESHWLSKEWWMGAGLDIENNEEDARNAVIIIRDLMFTDFVGFIQITFGTYDHAIRTILRGWNNEDSTGSFIKITKELFDNILSNINNSESDEYLNAFKMFGHIRNTIHNNGIHYNEDFPNVKINYKGLELHFQNKKPIEFTFNDLIKIISGCNDAMKEIVSDKTILNLNEKKMKDITQKFIDIYQV